MTMLATIIFICDHSDCDKRTTYVPDGVNGLPEGWTEIPDEDGDMHACPDHEGQLPEVT